MTQKEKVRLQKELKPLGKKYCTECEVIQPIEQFNFSDKKKGYRNSKCKECCKTRSKSWRSKNLEYAKEYDKKYNEENVEKRKMMTKRWRDNNPEKVKQYKQQYYKDNKELVNSFNKKWYNINKERINEKKRERYNNDEEYREYVLTKNKEYREENSELVSQRKKKYREENSDYIKEWYKEWYMNNQEKLRDYRKKYNTENHFYVQVRNHLKTKKKTEEFLSLWDDVRDVYNMYGISSHVDHKVPQSWFKEGSEFDLINHIDNLQVIDETYNLTKSNYWSDEVSESYYELIKDCIKDEYKKRVPVEDSSNV